MLWLIACSTPEGTAKKAALEYLELWSSPTAQYALVCADDREAKAVEEVVGQQETAKKFLGEEAWAKLEKKAEETTREVLSVSVAPDKTQATVVVKSVVPDGEPGEATVELEATTESGWCVVTEWAEAKVAAELTADIHQMSVDIGALRLDWQFEAAQAKLDEARALLGQFPDTREGLEARSAASGLLDSDQELLDLLTKDWVGGRWKVKESRDPMTDDLNVIATLQSTEGLPNVIGDIKPAHIMVRCSERKLDFYIATDSMLDADWRYNSVRGRHRFGDEPAEKFIGTRSTDYNAVFVRDNRGWAKQIAGRDGQTWRVELPLYQRGSQTVVFDLESSGVAVQRVLDACP